MIDTWKPRAAHGSPPCTYHSTVQNANQRTDEQKAYQRRGRKWATRIMQRVIWLFMYARDKHGTVISFEHPAGATSWQQVPELQALRAECYETVTHGCMWGLRNPFSGSLVKRSWRFIGSESALVNSITRRCDHSKRHQPIEGRMTALSSEYPVALCKAFAQAVMRPPKKDVPAKLTD